MQRACDSWRATFGSTANTAINSIYEHSTDDFSADADRQEFAQYQLESSEFLYGNVDSTVCKIFIKLRTANQNLIQPFRQLLQGPLIVHTLAAHFCAIRGAVKVPSLGDPDDLDNQPYGALGLSAAAVCSVSVGIPCF